MPSKLMLMDSPDNEGACVLDIGAAILRPIGVISPYSEISSSRAVEFADLRTDSLARSAFCAWRGSVIGVLGKVEQLVKEKPTKIIMPILASRALLV